MLRNFELLKYVRQMYLVSSSELLHFYSVFNANNIFNCILSHSSLKVYNSTQDSGLYFFNFHEKYSILSFKFYQLKLFSV